MAASASHRAGRREHVAAAACLCLQGHARRDHAAILFFFAGFLCFLAGFFLAVFIAVFCAANAPSELTIAAAGKTTAAPNAASVAATRIFFTGRLSLVMLTWDQRLDGPAEINRYKSRETAGTSPARTSDPAPTCKASSIRNCLQKRDRWDFWVDLIIPIGAALLLFLTLSSIFSDRHHAGEATRIAPGTNQLGAH